MRTPLLLAALALLLGWPARSQSDSLEEYVTAQDVLMQLDAAIGNNEMFEKRSSADTLLLVKEIVKLNQMQITMADTRREMRKQKQDGTYRPGFATPNDFNQSFYDLRTAVCKRYPGMVVDLDGTLRHCD